jgi:HK97 gp10 family phage protein
MAKGFRGATGKRSGGDNLSIIVTVDNSGEIARRLDYMASTVVTKTVFDLEAHAKNLVSQPGRGRIYGSHQASAPGDPPATDLGDLVGSIRGEMTDDHHGFVEVTSDHATPLEFGTVNMAPRPFMTPAIEQVRPSFEAAIRRVFDANSGV